MLMTNQRGRAWTVDHVNNQIRDVKSQLYMNQKIKVNGSIIAD